MKSLKISLLPAALMVLFSCNNEPKANSELKISAYEITKNFDTINIIDNRGLKQGVWLSAKDTLVYKNDTAYPATITTIDSVIKKLNGK